MSNRFHNKYHKHNHHTDNSASDIDSANDPIASASDPFLGDFHLSGDLNIISSSVISPTGKIDALESDTVNTNILGANGGSSIVLNDDLDLNNNAVVGLTLGGISDVDIVSPTLRQVLTYISGEWVNSDLSIDENSIGLTEINNTIWGAGLDIVGGAVTSSSSIPVGSIVMWVGLDVPSKWAECMGQSLSITTYSDLYGAVGQTFGVDDATNPSVFYIPDMRGMFVRGQNNGRNDEYEDADAIGRSNTTVAGAVAGIPLAGDNPGTSQVEQFKNHSHYTYSYYKYGRSNRTNQTVMIPTPFTSNSESTSIRGGTETRPNNIYVKYIMKVLI